MLPGQIDDPDDPELNPLLNPLLNENMDRWAQVYFTAPPDQRKKAVRELVHELQVQHSPRRPLASFDRQADLPQSNRRSQPNETRPGPSFDLVSFRAAALGSDKARSPRSPRHRYRVLALLVLVVAVLGAAYLGWRGPDAESVGSTPSVRPPATPTPAQAQAAIGTPAPGQVPSSGSRAITEAPDAAGADRGTARSTHAQQPVAASLTEAIGASPSAAAPAARGSAELTIAKSYLNGTDGKERDADEAVEWLWQAVGKQNTEATEILADLYLKGEGIPKNCEQARTLFDAAAHHGGKQAADRLSHWQDFGCD